VTVFLDGPAKDVKLMLRRAPHFLRAVQTPRGEWDALDQLDDTPRDGETVVVYVMVGEPTWMHVRATRGSGGTYRGGSYRLVEPQPSADILRDRAQWQAWARAQFALEAQL
jgi:hypothetical protein